MALSMRWLLTVVPLVAQISACVDGAGQWRLNRSNGVWRVRLVFDKSPALPKGYDTSILVSGSGQNLTLFQWVGEAGGQRFEFSR